MIEQKINKGAENDNDGHVNFAQGNNFYIFGSIDDSIPKNIIVPFIEAVNKQMNKKDPDDLNIYITSRGGFVNYGFDMIAHMERAKEAGINVNTYVTSEACSCGSLIAVAGSTRYIGKRAYHLLHFARGWDYSHNPIMMERNAEQGKFWQTELVNIYKKYTKIKDLEAKLLADNFMVNGAAACIRAGLADKEI